MRSRQMYRTAAGRNCDLAGIGLVPKLWAQDLPLRGQRWILTNFLFTVRRCRLREYNLKTKSVFELVLSTL